MYAETGLMFPHSQNFIQEVQQFDEFCCSQNSNAPLGISSSLIPSTISAYNLGGEGELFKAPEPVIGEPLTGLDPMMASISMISCGDDVITPQSLAFSNIESWIESGQLLSEVFYECRKDLLAKEGNEMPSREVLSTKYNPTGKPDKNFVIDEKLLGEGAFPKSTSSNCLLSLESVPEAPLRPRFLDFPVLDFEAYKGMRRAFSEGDIKILGIDDVSLSQSSVEQTRVTSSCTSEDRKEKLSRYLNKKSKRNFVRKIKYACRKALADSQPRIRGRFARTEEISSKMQ